MGGAAAAAIGVTAPLVAMPNAWRLMVAGLAGVAIAAWSLRANWTVSPAMAAGLIESEGSLDNLVVTAVELREKARPVRAEIRDEILRQAAARLGQVEPDGAATSPHRLSNEPATENRRTPSQVGSLSSLAC